MKPPLLAALWLSLAMLTIPRMVLGIGPESWSTVLYYAAQHNYLFGSELAYTYGPLGYLAMPYYLPKYWGLHMAFDISFTLWVCTGLCILAWRLPIVPRVTMLAFAALAAPVNFYEFYHANLMAHLGLFCWGMVCITHDDPPLAIILAAGCAVLMLVKVSFIIPAFATLIAVAIVSSRDTRREVFLASVGTLLLGWLMAGQHLDDIPAYLTNGLDICSGYDTAMGIEPARILIVGAIATMTPVVILLVRAAKRAPVACAWVAFFIFISWKSAFVRCDLAHQPLFFNMMPVIALATTKL